jgi:hypothetical protein
LSLFRPPRRLLYVTARGVDCWRVSATGLVYETAFDADEFAVARFYDYTESLGSQSPAVEYVVLADLVEEEFKPDAIPPVRGRDRKALIERRRTQNFRDTPYSTAVSFGLEQAEAVGDKRRDERINLLALTQTSAIDFWVKLLLANEHRVVGVASPALLSAAVLAQHAREQAGPQLLVTWNSAGLRQTFVEGGKPRFSRLNAFDELAGADTATLGQAIAAEIVRTRQYALTLRVLARDGGALDAIVVLPPELHQATAAHALDDHALRYRFVNVAVPTAKMASTSHGVAGLEALYLKVLRRGNAHGALPGFAPPVTTLFAAQAGARNQVIIGGALAGALGIGVAAWFTVQALGIGNQADQLRAQTAQATEQYRRVAATFAVGAHEGGLGRS